MNKKALFIFLVFSNLCYAYVNKKIEKEASDIFIPIYYKNETKSNIVNKLEIKNEIYILKNKNATDIIPVITGINGVKVKGIDNFLILNGTTSDILNLKKIIEKIDTQKKQVLLKLNVIDTSKNLFDRLGFNWRFNNGSNFTGILADFVKGDLSFTNLIASSSKIFDINIDALKEKGEIILKSSPNIVVLDGGRGLFKITDENIIELNKKGKKTNLISREAGIILEVFPKIYNLDDVEYVQVKLKAEISNFHSKNIKKQNVIETVVNVKNKKNMFIGGSSSMIKDDTKSKTPFLADIPIIGSLFTYKNKSNMQREIYMEIEVSII